jgi:hypothetical protein
MDDLHLTMVKHSPLVLEVGPHSAA